MSKATCRPPLGFGFPLGALGLALGVFLVALAPFGMPLGSHWRCFAGPLATLGAWAWLGPPKRAEKPQTLCFICCGRLRLKARVFFFVSLCVCFAAAHMHKHLKTLAFTLVPKACVLGRNI